MRIAWGKVPDAAFSHRGSLGVWVGWLLWVAGLLSLHSAETPIELDPGYAVRQWTTDNGLPQSTITCLRQTRDGYLWIGTRRGLARFDGRTFRVFIDDGVPGRASGADFHELEEDSEGWLWARGGTSLVGFKGGQIRRFSTREGVLAGDLRAARACRHGGLWVLLGGGLSRFQNGVLSPVLGDASEGALAPLSIGEVSQEDASGRLWVAIGGTLAGGDGGKRWSRIDPWTGRSEGLGDLVGPVPAVPEWVWGDRSGSIWMVAADGLYSWSEGRWSRYPTSAVWAGGSLGAPRQEDARGALWFLPYGGPIIRFHQGRFTVYGEAEGVLDRDIRAVWSDREANLWVGTGIAGLQQFEPRAFRTLLSTNTAGAKNEIYSVAAGAEGTVWLGMDSGLMRWRPGGFDLFTNAVPDPGGRIHQNVAPVVLDLAGTPWFGVRPEGFESLDRDRFVPHLTRADLGEREWTITALGRDRAGDFWIGSALGLMRWRGGLVAYYTTTNGLADNDVTGILEGANQDLWVGTATGGICRLREGRFESWGAREGLKAAPAIPLLVESDDTVWVGAPGGLYRIRGREVRAVTPREGLFGGPIHCLVDDLRGNYWAGGDQGIWRMGKGELHAVAEGRGGLLTCLRYGVADGIFSTEGNGDRQPSACRDSEGRLWFPTRRGVAVVDPAVLPEDAPPPVVIQQVIADRQVVWGDDAEGGVGGQTPRDSGAAAPGGPEVPAGLVRLGAGMGRVIEVHYSANSFVAPERIRFRYRLEGHDQDWVEDDHNRRIAYYPALSPGSYTFRVMACNSHQAWNAVGASIAFVLEPHFYQAPSFPYVCGLAAILLAVGVQSYRLKLQRRILRLEQQGALERERARIARDMHDDLGARLARVSLLSDLAARPEGLPRETAEHVACIGVTARETMVAMEELIWAVDPGQDTVASLVRFLGRWVEEFAGAAGLRCRVDIPGSLPEVTLDSPHRQACLLAVKEALRNIVKHAQATEVQFRVEWSKGVLRLEIGDDGRGFPRQPPGEDARHGHRGLRHIAARLEEIGGRVEFVQPVGGGTLVCLQLPFRDPQA